MAQFAALKEKYTIDEVARTLGLVMKSHTTGAGVPQLRARCPVHGGDERQLVITPSRANADGSQGAFFCWANKDAPLREKSGDLIQLVVHVRGCDARQAGEYIEAQFGTAKTIPPARAGGAASTVPQGRPGAVKRDKAEVLQKIKAELLPAAPELADLGIDEGTLRHFEAGWKPGGVLKQRLLIPLYSPDGKELLGFCGRAVKDGMQPDLQFHDFDNVHHLFNAHRVTEGELRYVTDPLDVLHAHQAGETNVVSFLTPDICSEQYLMLVALMDERGCKIIP